MRSSPLSLRDAMTTPVGLVLLFVSVNILLYSLIIAGQILLGIIPILFFASLYVSYRFLYAIEGIADGLQRIANAQEQIAELDDDRKRSASPASETSTASESVFDQPPNREQR